MTNRSGVQIEPESFPAHREGDRSRPLVVDLDGTLIATDSMWEAILLLAKRRPLDLLRFPFWLAGGRAPFKDRLFARVVPDATLLPYRQDVLAFLREQKNEGRRLVLATGSDHRMAEAVSEHLGLFDEFLASDGKINLTRHKKLAELERRFGPRGFDYAGNSSADLCLWQAGAGAYIVDAPRGVVRKARSFCKPHRVFEYPGTLAASLRALRPHQWVKNLLLLVPLVLAHKIADSHRLALALLALACFCLCASSVYLLNDLLDLESDRRHPQKRNRPLAAGRLMPAQGLVLMAGTLAVGLVLSSVALPFAFTALLVFYLALAAAYSLFIKRLLLVDVMVLSMLYTLRIVAGAAAVQVPLTMWLLAFSLFIFVSLAFAKRYSELMDLETAGGEWIHGRGYGVKDLRIIESVGPASGYLAVMVFCLYLDSREVRNLYIRHELLWLAFPILLYWITRIWFLARRRALHQDPILFALRDRVSYIAGVLMLLIVMSASLTFHGHWKRWPLPDNSTNDTHSPTNPNPPPRG